MSDLGRLSRRQVIVQHSFYGQSGTGTDVLVALGMDGQATGTTSTCNPGFPRAVKALNWWLNSATLGVNVDGDWTLRLRKNRTGTDIATGTWNPATLNDVAYSGWSKQVIIQPTEQYHLLADGPSRTFLLLRVILEWEVL